MGYATNAGTFLIETLVGLLLLVVLLRLIFQIVRADFRNPVSEFVVKVTNPMLMPMRRIIPSMGSIDTASIALLLVIQYAELFLITLINGMPFLPLAMLVLGVAKIIGLIITVFTFSILIQVVLSWVSPGTNNPMTSLLYAINEPVLGRARRIIPPFQGFDLSPIVAIIILQLLSMLIVAPLNDFSMTLG
ncbi:MAG: YggT family protein [Robiginitomaculum sp.]|nr:YggT family protein [Robiginitomaculum sp.]